MELEATDNPKDQPQVVPSRKTTGERYYDAMQFFVGNVWIVAFSGVLAYIARYGKAEWKVGGKTIPNYLEQFQEGFHNKLLHNKILPLADYGEFGKSLASANANTLLTCHGGNLFAPIMKWLENDKDRIAGYFNRRFGKPGEEAIGHERLKNAPQQTWGDIAKGRLGGWAIVAGSFLALDQALGREPKSGRHYFDLYEDWFGRKIAGFVDKEISHIPIAQELSAAQQANKMYRFGRIAALDIYATSAAIILWTAISRLSARNRNNHKLHAGDIPGALPIPIPFNDSGIPEPATIPPANKFQNAENMGYKPASHTESVTRVADSQSAAAII